jgi:predicted transcriptional regulator
VTLEKLVQNFKDSTMQNSNKNHVQKGMLKRKQSGRDGWGFLFCFREKNEDQIKGKGQHDMDEKNEIHIKEKNQTTKKTSFRGLKTR